MWTIENYKEVYARYEASGLSANDFCINERISRSRFYYWLRKYRKIQGVNTSCIKSNEKLGEYIPATQFIPLFVDSKPEKSAIGYPIKEIGESLPVPRSSSVPGPFMEIVYPSGTTVRLIGEKDMKLVKTLIDISR